jgi:YHS domain-containing protein
VEVGWRLGERVQVTSGLEPGERIVVSGNFLIDSESRMRLSASAGTASADKTMSSAKDPVCGMDVDTKAKDAIMAQHQGKTYYFCNEHCKRTFQADPGKYVSGKTTNPQLVRSNRTAA